MVVTGDVTEEERSAELYVSFNGGLDHTFLKRGGGELSPFQTKPAKSYLMLPLSPEKFVVCVFSGLVKCQRISILLLGNCARISHSWIDQPTSI